MHNFFWLYQAELTFAKQILATFHLAFTTFKTYRRPLHMTTTVVVVAANTSNQWQHRHKRSHYFYSRQADDDPSARVDLYSIPLELISVTLASKWNGKGCGRERCEHWIKCSHCGGVIYNLVCIENVKRWEFDLSNMREQRPCL